MGPYWAIGCLAEIYRAVAIIGVVFSIGLIPLTNGLSLIGLPIVFGYIVIAQLFRALIDIAVSTRGTFEIMKARSGATRPPPDPNGPWQDRTLKDDLDKLKRRANSSDDEYAPPRPKRVPPVDKGFWGRLK